MQGKREKNGMDNEVAGKGRMGGLARRKREGIAGRGVREKGGDGEREGCG